MPCDISLSLLKSISCNDSNPPLFHGSLATTETPNNRVAQLGSLFLWHVMMLWQVVLDCYAASNRGSFSVLPWNPKGSGSQTLLHIGSLEDVLKKHWCLGTSLMVQWLRRQAPNAGGTGSVPDWAAVILHMRCSVRPKKKFKNTDVWLHLQMFWSGSSTV